MKADLIVYNIGSLVTSREIEKTQDMTNMENIEIIDNAYLAVKDDKVLQVGAGEFPKDLVDASTNLVDAQGKVVTPGIVDSHTHLVLSLIHI